MSKPPISQIPWECKHTNLIGGETKVLGAVSAPMAKGEGGKDSESARRMRRIREAVQPGASASAFAQWLGITENRWINVENGHPISKEVAIRLRTRIPGMTTDYVLFGDPRHLSVETATKLGELPPGPKAHHGRS